MWLKARRQDLSVLLVVVIICALKTFTAGQFSQCIDSVGNSTTDMTGLGELNEPEFLVDIVLLAAVG